MFLQFITNALKLHHEVEHRGHRWLLTSTQCINMGLKNTSWRVDVHFVPPCFCMGPKTVKKLLRSNALYVDHMVCFPIPVCGVAVGPESVDSKRKEM